MYRLRTLLRSFTLFLLLASPYANSASFYWVGGSGNWSDTAHWATTSGGSTFHGSIPGLNDAVIFDDSSFSSGSATVTVTTSLIICDNMDWSTATFTPTFISSTSDTLRIYGSLILSPSMNFLFTGSLHFLSSTADSIESAGNILPGSATFNGAGSWKFKGGFATASDIIFIRGSLLADSVQITCRNFLSDSFQARSLKLNESILEANGSGQAWKATNSLSLTGTHGTIYLSHNGSDTVFFTSGVTPAYDNVVVGAELTAFTQAGTFDSLEFLPGSEIILPALATQIVNELIIRGNCALFILIHSSQSGFQATISSSADSVIGDYILARDINCTGGASFSAINSIDDGNVTGMTISEMSAGKDFFWIGGGGRWNDFDHWSQASGGSASTCIPSSKDNAIFDANSGFSGDTVLVERDVHCATMDWSAVTGSPSLFGPALKIALKGSLILSSNLNAAYTGLYRFENTSLVQIDANGAVLNGNISKEGNAQINLSDSLISNASFVHNRGTFNTNGFRMKFRSFTSSSGNTRNLLLGASSIELTGDSGQAWSADGPGLTFNSGTSSILISDTSAIPVYFRGGGRIYYDLSFTSPYANITAANTFNLLSILPGHALSLPSGTNTNVDSLSADGTCSTPTVIKATGLQSFPAAITKTGHDTLLLNGVILENVTADTLGGEYYIALNSEALYNTSGWHVSSSGIGSKFFWIGDGGNWSDTAHWSHSSGGTNTSCLPGIRDTVIFDANSFSSANQVVLMNVNGFCSVMDWSAATNSPTLMMLQSLFITRSINFVSSLTVSRLSTLGQIQLIPEGNNFNLFTDGASLNTSIIFDGSSPTDTLFLLDQLLMSDSSGFTVIEGRLQTNNHYIKTGVLSFFTTALKSAQLGSSVIDLKFGLEVESGLTLNAGTSLININGSPAGDYFLGGGLTYYDVNFFAVQNEAPTLLKGANDFHDLAFHEGLNIKLEGGVTQDVSGTFSTIGTCNDSIFIDSDDGTTATVHVTGIADTAEAVSIKNLAITTATMAALYSTNQGGNSGITFLTTPAANASFTAPASACFGDTVDFINTSTAISGNFADLSFAWELEDGDSAFVANPSHLYQSTGWHYVSLIASYFNGCSDLALDSIEINDPFVFLNNTDTFICAGESVTITASNTSLAYQFFVNGIAVTPVDTIASFTTTTLNDNDAVHVEAVENGCRGMSDTIIFRVNPLPVVTLSSSDANDSICNGDTVIFTAGGASRYVFTMDSTALGGFSTQTTFIINELTDGQIVGVIGRIDSTTCTDTSATTFTMTVSDIPTVSMVESPASNPICAGDSVDFTASGASLYEFFVGGLSQGAPSSDSTFTSASIANNQVVKVRGTSNNCSVYNPDSVTYSVNPIPNVTITSNDVDAVICTGNTVQFTSGGASVYQFFINDSAVTIQSGSNSYSTSTLTNGDSVSVRGSLNGCPDYSPDIIFTVNTPPTVGLTSSIPNDTICLNDTAIFTASGASLYQFMVNGFPATGITASSIYSTDSLTNSQIVSTVGYTNNCPASSNTFTMRVLALPNVIIFAADSVSCFGEPFQFNAAGASLYEFLINGVSQGLPTSSAIFITSALPAGFPQTSVIGTSALGCENTSSSLPVHVYDKPVITLTSSVPSNTICAGDTIIYSVTGANNYQFFKNSVFQGSNDSLMLSNASNGDTISAIGSVATCFSDEVFQTLTVNALPNVALTCSDINQVICAGDSVSFTASGGNVYSFLLNSSTVLGPSATSIYSTTSLQNADEVEVIGENTTTGCSKLNSSLLPFQVNPLPVVGLSCSDADTSICHGSSVTFTASGANLYEFFLNGQSLGSPSTSTQYITDSLVDGDLVQVSGRTALNCSDFSSAQYIFHVQNRPSVSLTSSDADGKICIGDTVLFTASGAQFYQFFLNSDSVGSTSTNSVFESSLLQHHDTIEVVGIFQGCENEADTFYHMLVYAYPVVQISANMAGPICTGDSVTVSASGAPVYEFFINGLSQGSPSPVSTLTTTGISNGQAVSVTGGNNGCKDSDSTAIYTVYSYPVTQVLSSIPGNTICFGDSIVFTASGAQTYEFILNGYSQGAPDSANTYYNPELEDGDVITVIGYNGHCASASADTNTMTVRKMNLTLSINPGNPVCEKTAITFTGSGADLYEFFVDGLSQGTASSNTVFSSSTLSDGQTVEVMGTNTTFNCNLLAEEKYLLSFLPVPEIGIEGDTVFCTGDSAVLSSDIPLREWQRNGLPIVPFSGQELIVKNSGIYTAVADHRGSGTAWSSGQNAMGQLGDSTLTDALLPVKALDIDSASDIDCGKNFNIACDAQGRVYAWGDNNSGQLGNGSFADEITPFELGSLSDVTDVAAGSEHSLAITSAGDLYSWGRNNKGQLGLGTTSVTNFPFQVSISNVVEIAAGEEHSLALLSDGSLWAWGSNQYGQLGDSSLTDRLSPVQVKITDSVVHIGVGYYHSLAITSDGSLWIWGNNANGQLGLNGINFSILPVEMISLGFEHFSDADGGEKHSMALTNEGRVYTWGDNASGQLGDGSTNPSLIPLKLDEPRSVTDISSGPFQSIAKRSDQTFWAWGKNSHGEMGDSSTTNKITPEAIVKWTGMSIMSMGLNHASAISGSDANCTSRDVQIQVDSLPIVTIVPVGNLLQANAGGSKYEWFINGNIITSATSQTFQPMANGMYKVRVTFSNGCSGTSEEFEVNYISVDSYSGFGSDIIIVPNPNTGVFRIDGLDLLLAEKASFNIYIYDNLGRVIFNDILDSEMIKSDIAIESGLAKDGLYFAVITTGTGIIRKSFIIRQ